jgi:hypothetical protein
MRPFSQPVTHLPRQPRYPVGGVPGQPAALFAGGEFALHHAGYLM